MGAARVHPEKVGLGFSSRSKHHKPSLLKPSGHVLHPQAKQLTGSHTPKTDLVHNLPGPSWPRRLVCIVLSPRILESYTLYKRLMRHKLEPLSSG